MVDTAVVSDAPAPATPVKKSKASAVAKKPKTKATHPPTSEMVNNAIKELKERNGSSLQAIKKYVAAQYKVDAEKLAPFIRKYLKNAVESGGLVQTKGKGASGSFKLEIKGAAKKPASKVAKPAKAKLSPKKKPAAAKPVAKKPASPKRAAPAQRVTPAAAKSPKAKKSSKPPTKKQRSPWVRPTKKPRSLLVWATSASAAKKVAAKKPRSLLVWATSASAAKKVAAKKPRSLLVWATSASAAKKVAAKK